MIFNLKTIFMGSMKDEWMNRQEDERNKMLAKILEITPEELNATEWKFDEPTNNDGMVTDLLVIFDPNHSPDILKRIKGIDGNYTVWLDPNDLENFQELDEIELGGEG